MLELTIEAKRKVEYVIDSLYNNDRNKLMQSHAILHEVGHMLLDHKMSTTIVSNESNISQQLKNKLLLRTHFRIHHEELLNQLSDQQEEAEAELFVRLINGRRFAHQQIFEIRQNSNITLVPPFTSRSE